MVVEVVRCDPISGGAPKRNHGSDWVDNYFAGNTALVHPNFLRPDDYTLGDAPRTLGSLRSPSHFTTDLSVGKQFLRTKNPLLKIGTIKMCFLLELYAMEVRVVTEVRI